MITNFPIRTTPILSAPFLYRVNRTLHLICRGDSRIARRKRAVEDACPYKFYRMWILHCRDRRPRRSARKNNGKSQKQNETALGAVPYKITINANLKSNGRPKVAHFVFNILNYAFGVHNNLFAEAERINNTLANGQSKQLFNSLLVE